MRSAIERDASHDLSPPTLVRHLVRGDEMSVKLSELIAQYGDDNIEFQNLDHCVEHFQTTKRGTIARFGTPQAFSLDGFIKLGLVVWMDRKKVDEIVAKSKELKS